jgi:NhaP-type Na+/H+ or K+/H+ antiporter
MIRLKLGSLVIRTTLLEITGLLILVPGLVGMFTHSLSFWESLLLLALGIILMQDRYYVRWVVQRKEREYEERMASLRRATEAQTTPQED